MPSKISRTLLAKLRQELKALYGDNLVTLVLFGSYARGEAGSHSDIDVALVLKDFTHEFLEIDRTSKLVYELSLENKTTVSLIPMRESDWRENVLPFYQSLRQEGVSII